MSVSGCIYGTGTITMARRSIFLPTSNRSILGGTHKTTHCQPTVSVVYEREREPVLSRVLSADGQTRWCCRVVIGYYTLNAKCRNESENVERVLTKGHFCRACRCNLDAEVSNWSQIGK